MSDNFETKGTIARNSTDEILVKTISQQEKVFV